MNDFVFFRCPHCDGEIVVKIGELNCHIFRHGIYKKSWKQIDPHLNKKECDRLFLEKEIYGCGRPFKMVKEMSLDESKKRIIKYNVETCDYI